ncbi:MAG TPA: flagellar basal-body MS-ring/collar protein FliF [Candidatus Hydrogenedentes bacterium]|nr:flagellar basal-body MS-ring/collar protein FliF [Candidatus Hydrogenedentota bacterium]HPC15440.1 flagellar basal-body MS-ring/collar protein FliF [Candidatus Hydrogenedentota bacterium]HRT21121.1 flagellar basal-body MS-ring/collar protein FliF [Candidatus Hydrogenedentota bacterium]HRT64346.1 flagellar basal-body MS-ring/collar protein FliF [Candidatus Hydrogenedentota bacterium]
MDFLRQLISGLVQMWQRLNASARINIVLALLATIALIGIMVATSGRAVYVRLYDGINPDELPKIADALSAERISYRLADNDQTILVPQNDRSRARMALSGKGLPAVQGRVPGFELFKEQDIMSNRWMQDVKYMRAVQGELQRQLDEFDFVNKSFVFIREAKDELFTTQQRPSKAAVTLDVRRKPNRAEIKAILHTISSFGGANLGLDNITLVTTDGTPLHLPPTSQFASIANSKLEYIAELEKQREERVLRDFERLGVQALVKVSAVVDFDQQTETVTLAEEGTPISTYTTSTTTSNRESLAQGAPGAIANLPEGSATPGGNENKEETTEQIQNFQPSTTETKTVREPGKVKQYIVSALIEGDVKKSTDASGVETTEYIGLSPERKKIYEDYIRAAVGEGETPTEITVNDQPFNVARLTDATGAFQAIESAKNMDRMLQYGTDAGKVLLVIAGFLLVRRFLRRAIVTPVEEAASEVPIEEPIRLDIGPSAEDRRREEIASEVSRLSETEPDSVAAVIRSWLAQED